MTQHQKNIFLKVVRTNWINFVGVFTGVFLYALILELYDVNVSYNLFQCAFAALILVLGYGMMFWGMFTISLLVMDFILLRNLHKLNLKILMEWFIISIPFLYWTIEYHEWIFLIAIATFLLTQLLRGRTILAI